MDCKTISLVPTLVAFTYCTHHFAFALTEFSTRNCNTLGECAGSAANFEAAAYFMGGEI